MPVAEVTAHLRLPHPRQLEFIRSPAKRRVVRAGRRGGKTVGIAILACEQFLAGRRVLYAAPTSEQTGRFWFEVTAALAELIDSKIVTKNESEQFIERPRTENRIKAKTAWNSSTLRGDYADLLILDEWQLMAEDTWDEVGAPMLLDNNGDAVFIYTPPSLRSTGVSKARDPRHASKMFKAAQADTTGRWAAFSFSSHDNPYISAEALEDITRDMSLDAYRKEILAQDDEIEQSWLVYGKYDSRICTVKRFPIPASWLIYSGHDFGTANPAALFVAQDPATGQFYIYREYLPGAGHATADNVKAFLDISQGYNVLRRVGGNQTTEEEIRGNYTAHGWPITAPKLGKVNAQIDRVIGMLELNKVFIFEDCYNVLTEIANCMWELDSENKPTKDKIKDEAKYHLLACLRYLLSDFAPETAIPSGGVKVRRLGDRR